MTFKPTRDDSAVPDARHPAGASGDISVPLRVLVVEDDDNDAELTRQMLRSRAGVRPFVATRVSDVKTALAELRILDVDAVLLDLGLPDSVRFSALEQIRGLRPLVPIVVITGSGEGSRGVEAVRLGAQDFLVKDQMTSAALEKSLQYSIERVRALTIERQLLEETLHGAIEALTTVLALVNPTAFGRAQRLKEYVAVPLRTLAVAQPWAVEVAAMVSQIGWVQHSPEECEQHYTQKSQPPEGRRLVEDMPAIAAELLKSIPHLESVREILALQVRRSGRVLGTQVKSITPEVRLGAELLFLAIQFDLLETQLGSKSAALEGIRGRSEEWDARVFRAFIDAQQAVLASNSMRAIPARELVEGMVLADDVLMPDGRIIVARGHDVTPSLLARLRLFGERAKIVEPLRVYVSRSETNGDVLAA